MFRRRAITSTVTGSAASSPVSASCFGIQCVKGGGSTAAVVGVAVGLFEQMLEVAPKPGRDPLGDARFGPALRLDQRVGAEPFDCRRGRQDDSRASAGVDEPADQALGRPRLLGFFAEPVSELARRAAREGPESVQATQLGKMLVPGLGPDRVVGELVPVQVELASDEIHDGRRHELAGSQQAAGWRSTHSCEAQLVAGAPPGPDVLQGLGHKRGGWPGATDKS